MALAETVLDQTAARRLGGRAAIGDAELGQDRGDVPGERR
jgi:hypothetical protein